MRLNVKLFFCFLILLLAYQGKAQERTDTLRSQTTGYQLTPEKKVNFNKSLSNQRLEYNLEPISEGSFKLIFVNQPSEYVRIKIYDIIGNLILSEDKRYALNSEIEYNFNEKNNKIFVVKVESGNDNLIKKVNF